MKRWIKTVCAMLALLRVMNAAALPAAAAELETVGATAETAAADAPASPEATVPVENAEGEMPLYYQQDYPNTRYGNGTIATGGCGIVSLAMVASFLTGREYLPDELAFRFGDSGVNNVERLENASDALQLSWTRAEDFHDVMAALKAGNVAIVLMNKQSIFTDEQHFIVLSGLTQEGKILVKDPFSPNYERWEMQNAFQNGFDEGDVVFGYSSGWIYDVSAVPEEPIIYETAASQYGDLELTWEEQQLLAKMIWVEAQGEPARGQQAIAEIVLNRMVSEDFPDTLKKVIYQKDAFRSAALLEKADAWTSQYAAIDRALHGPNVLPLGVVYFDTKAVNDHIWGKIGGHVFCYDHYS